MNLNNNTAEPPSRASPRSTSTELRDTARGKQSCARDGGPAVRGGGAIGVAALWLVLARWVGQQARQEAGRRSRLVVEFAGRLPVWLAGCLAGRLAAGACGCGGGAARGAERREKQRLLSQPRAGREVASGSAGRRAPLLGVRHGLRDAERPQRRARGGGLCGQARCATWCRRSGSLCEPGTKPRERSSR
jgi:hypothetical protein